MVYLFVDSSGFGGIESHIHQLALMLQSQQVDVEVVFLSRYPGHPLYSQLEQASVPFRFLADTSTIRFFRRLSSRDVVHAHGYKASILARGCRVLAAFHLVTTFHAGEAVAGKLACYEWFNRYSACLSRNLAVSRKIQQRQPFHCELQRNFVRCGENALERKRHHRLQVGFVGRLSHEKAIDRFASLCQQLPSMDFHVFGDGEQASLLDNAPLNWHGFVSSMAPYWHQLDVLLITSRAEGMPMAALEAMANGVVVIATDVGEMPSLLDSQWLVEEAQWPKLADKLQHIEKRGEAYWFALSQQQQQMVRANYSDTACWQQLSQIYQLSQ
ncbi:glycosyltransferase family 4 protein [Photobacterium rosenbergii]|uniref:Glycosyltransferase family 4 protein n=1 Tax=Photobacterium rosenbergii TaxID=294936 RepID=A0ABU3ZPF6_9GAMM|nr:glycosyltransferase family 4 protein [Photobacterium rosenbergii]MDV5171942.1 glycosyltransferase family 4 protein [Photobacterium rosenbergii]